MIVESNSNCSKYVEGYSNSSIKSQVSAWNTLQPLPDIESRAGQITDLVPEIIRKEKLKTLDKNWRQEVVKYRDRVFYSYKGENVYLTLKSMGFNFKDVNPQDVVATVRAIIGSMDADGKEIGKTYAVMPCESIWAFTSPYASTTYKRVQKQYQAMTVVKALELLDEQDIILYKRYEGGRVYTKGKCRRIGLTEKFVMYHEQVITQTFFDLLANLEVSDDYHMTSQPRGDNFDRRTPDVTKRLVKKLQQCKFRFNTESLDTGILANLTGVEANASYVESIVYALAGINIRTNSPQYHGSYHQQASGRLHTVGGAISMSQELRKLFIAPVNPNNLAVDVDLASAQLFMLCKILNLPQMDQTIRKLLAASPNNSLWPYIASNSKMPKSAKKTILYAFCFGGAYNNLPFIVNNKLKSKGLNYKVTSADIDGVLKNSSILAPLVEARENFLSEFSLDNILSGKTSKIISNDLGNKFRLYNRAMEYEGNDKFKVASQLLAFLAQGAEQNIIQHLLVDLNYNILAFQYDGFTLECGADLEFIEMIDRVNSLCNYPLSYEIL